MISFFCSQCGLKFEVKPEFAGRSSRCPTCKQPLVVPAPDKTHAEVAAGQIDGTNSSLAKAGVDGGVTLEPVASVRHGQKSVQQLLSHRARNDGRYIIEGELARGGMGTVLRAVDCDIRREVAVKYLLDQANPDKKLRFVAEAQITGQLEHPNIVPIHELGTDNLRRLFFSMKMVRGKSLAQVLNELRENPRTAEKEYSLGRLLNILVNVCNALAYAHSRGVLHRDLKPANIMIGDFGEVYVMDWGLAKVVKGDAPVAEAAPMAIPVAGAAVAISPSMASRSSSVMTSREPEADLTQEGAVLGTPVYMPPEQASGNVQAVDQRSDVYSLGAILYEMLTLQPPVSKDGGYLAILMRVMQGEIVPPEQRAKAAKIPKELSAITMKALAKNPQDRYPSVEALRQDVERFQEGRSVSAKEDTFRETVWKLVKRNRGVSLTAGIAAFILIGVLSFSFQAIYNAYSTLQQEQTAKRQQGKKSAPLFFQNAKTSATRKEMDYALAQVNVALEYDPDIAEARLLKGQLLIVARDFTAARRELEQYVRHQPKDQDAAQLVALCQQARAEDASSSAPFVEVFERQKAFSLAEQMVQDRDKLLQLYRQRIDTAWRGFGQFLLMNTDGKCSLNLSEGGPVVSDLTPLQGIPLTKLDLGNCGQVRDLTPLKGMPLTILDLRHCGQVRDLTPLHGMKLTTLSLTGTAVTDLAPLKGMPLAILYLHGCSQVTDLALLQSLPLTHLDIGFCKVQDLTPLRGLRLTGLSLYGCGQVRDLTPLRGMPLGWLNLQNCGQINDLTPLRGMPLAWLNLYGCWQVKDLTPLQGLNLGEITLTPRIITAGMVVLRSMKSLKTIRVGSDMGDQFKPEEFWKRYDAGEFNNK